MTEFDLIVIGSGPGGYVAAIRAAQLGFKTACVEKSQLGGTCLNVGCIPSKALLHSSQLFEEAKEGAQHHGIRTSVELDFDKMMSRKTGIVSQFNGGIGHLFKKNKVTHIEGYAKFTSSTEIDVDGQRYKAKHFIIATGSEPISLPFLPIDEERIVTSTGALSLKEVPKRLAVVGAGIIGVELGSVYRRLGAEVTFVEFLDRICPTLEGEVSKQFQRILEKQGLKFHTSTGVEGAEIKPDVITLKTAKEDIDADVVLVAIGRRPYTEGLGLDAAGVKLDEKGRIAINRRFETSVPNIYAIGDVVDGPMLAHKASEEGIALVEMIAGQSPTVEEILIPNVVYTDPEIASVGLTTEQCKERGIEIKTGKFPMMANSRAGCTGQGHGFVKILSDAKTDRIVGMHILASHASELIAAGVVAMSQNMTAEELGAVPFAHPTLSEAIKEAAHGVHDRMIHI